MACHGCHALGVHYYLDSFPIGAKILAVVVIWVRSKEVGQMDGSSKSLIGGLGLGLGNEWGEGCGCTINEILFFL